MASQLDIINRALQKIGKNRIGSLGDQSANAAESVFAWDTIRRAELRRNIWRFSIRTVAIRALATTTKAITFGTWASGTTYVLNDIVTGSDGRVYIATAGSNLAHDPTSTLGFWTTYSGGMQASLWDSTLSYWAGELVYVSATVYLSTVSANTVNPVGDLTGAWITLSTAPTIAAMNFIYPIGAGPDTLSSTRNVFMLPNAFLREAPQAPKAGRNAFLGGPAGIRADDWNFENYCFTSFDTGPVMFRFAADVTDTTQYDPLFVEGLACRIGLEMAEPLTENAVKLKALSAEYKKFMGEARTVNGIETGPTEPPLDEYIAVRV